MLTFVVIVIDELLCRYHVEQLQYFAFFLVCRCGASQHGHGIDTHLNTCYLCKTDACLLDLQSFVANSHAIEALDRNICGSIVDVFAKGNTLGYNVSFPSSIHMYLQPKWTYA